MITRDALYTFVEDLISNAVSSSPLDGAVSARNLRTSVDSADKVVRVECFEGSLSVSNDPKFTEQEVKATIQCWVLPAGTEQADLDDATDESFEMARTIFEAIVATPHLDGTVCDAKFSEFETGYANLGATPRGVTYLDGMLNQ